MLAGHGFVVLVPEIYHEYEPAGTVLAYDQASADRGNALKTTKPLDAYDTDARAALAYVKASEHCTGALGVVGICIGGHLAFRAAMNPGVLAVTCFYATDIHKRGLGAGMNDNTLDRVPELKAEALMIFGRRTRTSPSKAAKKSKPPSSPPARISHGTSSTAPTRLCATKATATTPSSPSNATASPSTSSAANSAKATGRKPR